MALYTPHSIFHLARLLYVRPETFGPYYVYAAVAMTVDTSLQTNKFTFGDDIPSYYRKSVLPLTIQSNATTLFTK